MPQLNAEESDYKKKLIDLSWKYLYTKFRNFKQANKIHVAIAIAQKDMASKLEHSGEVNLKIPQEEIDYRVRRLKRAIGEIKYNNQK